MLKLLYILFRKRFNKLAYEGQTFKRGFDGTEKIFIDSDGNSYFRYKNDFDIPIQRFKEIQLRLRILNSGLSLTTLGMICDNMEKALNSGKKSDLAEIGYLIKEIRKRENIYIDNNLLYDIICLTYIREDENPAVIDWVKHKEKVERLKIDSQGVLYDFFHSSGLMGLIPFVGTTEEEWSEYLMESEVKMKALTAFLNHRSTVLQS